MSRASQQNSLLIQHCYNPCRTTQLEKIIKNRQKGPVLAIKGAVGNFGGPQRTRFSPDWPEGTRYQAKVCGDHELNPGKTIGGHQGPNLIPRGPPRTSKSSKGAFGPKRALLEPRGVQKGPDTRSKFVVTMSPAWAGQSGASRGPVGPNLIPQGPPRTS